jgi:hypothetical protein
MRITSRRLGAFSQRDIVGCDHRSSPVSGKASASQLEAAVAAQIIEIVDILIAAGARARLRGSPVSAR